MLIYFCFVLVLVLLVFFFFFFFKQKTAYEIYQCDWSSDVCSSDLCEGTNDWCEGTDGWCGGTDDWCLLPFSLWRGFFIIVNG